MASVENTQTQETVTHISMQKANSSIYEIVRERMIKEGFIIWIGFTTSANYFSRMTIQANLGQHSVRPDMGKQFWPYTETLNPDMVEALHRFYIESAFVGPCIEDDTPRTGAPSFTMNELNLAYAYEKRWHELMDKVIAEQKVYYWSLE